MALSNAEKQARHRQQKADRVVLLRIEAPERDLVSFLIRRGLLPEEARKDRAMIENAAALYLKNTVTGYGRQR